MNHNTSQYCLSVHLVESIDYMITSKRGGKEEEDRACCLANNKICLLGLRHTYICRPQMLERESRVEKETSGEKFAKGSGLTWTAL